MLAVVLARSLITIGERIGGREEEATGEGSTVAVAVAGAVAGEDLSPEEARCSKKSEIFSLPCVYNSATKGER